MKYQRMLYKREREQCIMEVRNREGVERGEEGKVRVWVVLLARRDEWVEGQVEGEGREGGREITRIQTYL